MEKNDAQISRAAVAKKAPIPCKKNFQKKIFPVYLYGQDLQNGVPKFL